MKKLLLLNLFFILSINLCYSQLPPNKTRSNGTFTELDHYLNVTEFQS